MSFLTPLFLVGLAGLAIPVVLHLIQKERRNVVQFPSLMFIRRIPYQSVQRRRIRHWLLLAMRLAALALLVLAFGRPFFRRTDAAAASGSGAREVVVLLDRSYSMGFGGRWQKALSAAQSTINGLKPTDRGTVVLFASNAEVALRSTSDRSRLLACRHRNPARRRRDTVRSGLEAGRQHPERVGAAAARSDPDHRFPADWLAGCGRRPPAGRFRADDGAGRRQRCREPVGDTGCACSVRRSRTSSG